MSDNIGVSEELVLIGNIAHDISEGMQCLINAIDANTKELAAFRQDYCRAHGNIPSEPIWSAIPLD